MKTEFEKQKQNTNTERICLEKGRGVEGVPDGKLWVMFRLVLLPRLAFLPFLGNFLSCKEREGVIAISKCLC